MTKPLPDWATRALSLHNCEAQAFKTDRSADSIRKTLARAGLTDFKIRKTVKPGFWFVCRKDWPETMYAKRTMTDKQRMALAEGREGRGADLG